MNPKILILLLILFSVNELCSAQESSKGFVSINAGIGIPMGEFGKGYVKTGLNLNLSFAIPLNPNFGLGIKIGRDASPFDKERFLNDSKSPGLDNITYTLKMYADENSVTRTYFTGGIFAFIPFQKFSLDIGALIGYATHSYPEVIIDYKNFTTGDYGFEDNYVKLENTFAYDLCLGIRYSFTDKFCGNLNFDFVHTSPESSGSYRHYSYTNVNNIYEYEFSGSNMPISIFSITAGVGYQFGK